MLMRFVHKSHDGEVFLHNGSKNWDIRINQGINFPCPVHDILVQLCGSGASSPFSVREERARVAKPESAFFSFPPDKIL
jgi:hypothetical protein